MRIAFVAEGDAETADCWSGCARGFVGGLRSRGAQVECFNLDLRSWRRYAVAARTFSFDRRRWRWRYRLGTEALASRSALGLALLRHRVTDFDVVVQTGALADLSALGQSGGTVVVYSDSNAILARRGSPYSGMGSIPEDDFDAIVRSERRVYESADRIWTFSELAACSFVEDFGQSSTKVKAIFAGANVDTTRFSEGRDSVRLGRKSVLFVGRDYRRKGIDTLFEAWPMVRKRHPEALLHVVGGHPEGVPSDGVKVHGFIPSGSEEGARHLGQLYSEATLFCLPTRYEPFGVAFVEAMLAGLPCVGPASWAVPEIIVDGKTGWLFRDGSAKDLARVLSEAMDDPAHAQRLGLKARERASALFTWEKVAARALEDLERMVGGAFPHGASRL